MVIFDSHGVRIDSEPLAATLLGQGHMHAGYALTPGMVARFFTGRRPSEFSPRWKSPPCASCR